MTVDEFIAWGETWPGAEIVGPFPLFPRKMLEEMALEGYGFEIRDGAPYIVPPQENHGV